MAQVKINVKTDTLQEAASDFQRLIDKLESGDMTVDEMVAELRQVVDGINELASGISRTFNL